MRTTFSSESDMQRYLRFSPAGQRMVESCLPEVLPRWICTLEGAEWMDKVHSENGKPRLLVVVSGDGYIECISTHPVDVKIVQHAYNGKQSIGTPIEDGCKDYAKSKLSLAWREVWEKGRLIAGYMFSRKYLAEEHAAEVRADMLRKIRELKV